MNVRIVNRQGVATTYSETDLKAMARQLAKQEGGALIAHWVEVREDNQLTRVRASVKTCCGPQTFSTVL